MKVCTLEKGRHEGGNVCITKMETTERKQETKDHNENQKL